MGTKTWRLNEQDLRAWLDGLLAGGRRVVAPVEREGLRRFRAVGSADEVCLDPGKTRASPKEFLFPATETLYRYTLGTEGPELHDPPMADAEQVLVGVRCCDAAGLTRLDDVFLKGGVEDPLYARRRALTTVVAFACSEAGPECFCTAVGGSPMGSEGVDLLVLPFEDDWLARPLTEKGEALVPEGWSPATRAHRSLAEEQVRHVEERIDRSAVPDNLAAMLESNFDHPAWQDVARRCLSCSICAYVCPSCSCFDVHHEGNAWAGREFRCWDACTYALFTRHASGHDPRGTRDARYRQRALHKFAYLAPDEKGVARCTGCGRCLRLCPVGIDIHDAVCRVAAASREGEADGQR